jgi:O-acetyl-ADP-ribose deacetylase (regulator of RNase III)
VLAEDVIYEKKLKNKKIIRLVKGDITERNVDAIVNAADSYLNHGGGVAGAIVNKGGRIIQDESDEIGFVPVGSSAMTSAGKLPCRVVIHTVGPKMGEGNEEEKLSNAINSVFKLASQKGLKSLSIPAISSGIFGFPKDKCAKILVNESLRFFLEDGNNSTIQFIEFCIINDFALKEFKREFELLIYNSTIK